MKASTTEAPVTDTGPREALKLRAVVSGSIGNLLEQYDNLVYAYSTVYLSAAFFSSGGSVSSLLSTFAVFAVGFLARPLGTVFFGHIGDKMGRRPALLASVILMGAATVLIGLLPGYRTIGVAAPVLLVVLRLFQGFAVAGEWAGSAAMLVEYATPRARGRYGSLNQVSTAAGFLVAAGVVALNSLFWSEQGMREFGWRVPFLVGAVTAVVALLLRFGLEDTPAFREQEAAGETSASPLRLALRTQKGAMARGFFFTVSWTVAYFFFLTYLPTHLRQEAGIAPGIVEASNIVGLVVLTVAIFGFGVLSDRIGRKPLLLIGSGGLVLLSFPAMLVFQTGNTAGVFLGQILIGLIIAAFSGPGPAALAELFPTNVRYSALGIGYNFSVMAFGGTAGFIATLIVDSTGNAVLVALLPTIAALITFVTVCRMPETYRTELK
ncbi:MULTISPECIES: MFS transporter [unclassified Streptomyces]|uniref:MFS transporter n=1 Tax=unclassified Streptomyces TaxID=2593676 RepID=UPI002E80C585|nr:MFS transporter [Streptomyces sp. NBC_00569]WSE13498.1 MFS transporter [Streptomyces sp. NBC_01397]WUB97584.1 MFS transporter [Streptomyces sp. NBC_00569]